MSNKMAEHHPVLESRLQTLDLLIAEGWEPEVVDTSETISRWAKQIDPHLKLVAEVKTSGEVVGAIRGTSQSVSGEISIQGASSLRDILRRLQRWEAAFKKTSFPPLAHAQLPPTEPSM